MNYTALLIILLILCPLIYFLPTIIANLRHHHNRAAIFILNLFLGLTLLGWIISLVWAFTSTIPPTPEAPPYQKPPQ